MDIFMAESEVSDTQEESFLLAYLCLFGSILYFLWLRRDKTNYKNIPAVGFSGTVTSFISALGWLHDQAGVVQKGYSRFPNGIFRYPTLTRWVVVVARPQYVEELRKAPEDEVSASEAMEELLGVPSTINSKLLADQELKALLGAQLTRKLHDFVPDIYSLVSEFTEKLISASEEKDWKYIDEVDILTRICIQTINHVMVGTPLNPDSEVVDQLVIFSKHFGRYVGKSKRFPRSLRPLYLFLFTPLSKIKRCLRALLVAILKERHEIPDDVFHTLPNDMITWFTSRDVGSEMSVDELVAHVLLVNHLAVHPMVQVMGQALRNLAIHSDCIIPLRKEVEEATRYGGWTKASIDTMHKLDSFLKETMRLDPSILNSDFPSLTMPRKCRRPMTFSDGATAPQGALLFVGSQLLHTDARYYPKPELFDPLRFVPSPANRDASVSLASSSDSYPGPSSSSSTFIPVSLTLPATSSTFLAWGHGKHACPGRFFAASVMKLMLARFVYEFDFRAPPVHVSSGEDGTIGKIPWIELRKWRRQQVLRVNP